MPEDKKLYSILGNFGIWKIFLKKKTEKERYP